MYTTTDYRTTDLGLATYLSYKGFILGSTEDGSKPGQKIFVFERKPGSKIENVAEEYIRGEALVEPKQYQHAQRDVKQRIYQY